VEITPEIQALLDAQKAELQTTFDESIVGLKQNNHDLLNEKKEAQRIKDEAVAKAGTEALAAAKAKGDIESVTNSYDEKVMSLQAIIDGLNGANLTAKKSQLASDFLTKYGTGSQLALDAMSNEYQARIDIRDGRAVVLDPEGNLTALTVEDLNKEFTANSRYADNIKVGGSIGGGATGNKGSGGAVSLKDMTATQEAKFANEHPELYKQMIK
jgi:hypothetical protein